jgi:glycosyltransferase involved in cell wall biosynthesis
MKIIHLASQYPPEKVFGLGRFVQDLAIEQVRTGHEVHVVTNSMSGRDHEALDNGVQVHRVDFPPPPKPPDNGSTVTQFNVQLIERVFKDCICPKVDVVNAHDWLTALAGEAAARRRNAAFVATIHDLVVGKRFNELDNESRYVGNIEHWLVREADDLICVSHHTREEAIARYGAPADKTHAIYNAVSEERFKRPDPTLLRRFRRALASDEERLVLYVGRLDPEKGVEILLQAFASVLGEHLRAKLILAGSGTLEEELRKKSIDWGADKATAFAGYVQGEALNYLYHCADVLAVPSLYEPFGIVALEGMICGAAVVASDTGGLSEILRGGRDGLLVKPGSVADWSRALIALLSDAQVRRKFAENGQRKAQRVYSWKRVAEAVMRIYELALSRRRAREVSAPSDRSAAGTRRKPRVLFDCTAIHEGMTGIGLYAQALLRHLPNLWPEAEWILLATPRNHAYLSNQFRFRRVVGGAEYELRYPARQKALGRLMERMRGDIYFGPMFDAAEEGAGASVTKIHDLSFLKFPGMLPPELTEYTSQAAEHAARTAHVIFTGSEWAKAEIVNHYHIPHEKVVVVHDGVDDCLVPLPGAEAQAEVRRRYQIEGPFILAVNLTNVRKNARRLFEAHAALVREESQAPTLVVAGGWSLSEANLWRLAYEAGIHRRIAIAGYLARDELLALYAQASALCMPSLEEGFGLPAVEAMACGVPVVTSDRSAMREVTNGAAVLVEPESVESIARGIRRVLHDETLRLQCISKGKERAKRFTWRSAAEKVAGVLRSVWGELSVR